jgi:hypothetical protein
LPPKEWTPLIEKAEQSARAAIVSADINRIRQTLAALEQTLAPLAPADV